MHSLIPVDQDGTPIMNMITWADNRSAQIAEEIRSSKRGEAIYLATGTPIHSMSPLGKIIWLRENEPALFSRSARFVSIKEYVWHRMFGVFEVDHSIASATGLFDLVSCEWYSDSLDICGITNDQLSKPVPVTHVRNEIGVDVSKQLGIPSGTPFMIGSSDGCLANIGSHATAPGIAALTIGTSGAIRVASKTPKLNFKAMTFCYRVFDTMFVCGGPINNGGGALKWFAENMLNTKLTSGEDYDKLLDPIGSIKPASDGVLFVPYLLGERAPHWDSRASAVFFGLRQHHTRHHMTRAVVEGISMALYSISQAMEQAGLDIDKIHVSGGFVHSDTWLQLLADVFGKEIHLIHEDDASAIGAAYLGLTTLKLVDADHDFQLLDNKVYYPQPSAHEVYKNLFQRFDRLYDLLRDEMWKVSNLSTN
jgi:gluconokinase